MGLYLLYGAALFGVSVQALAFETPRPTDPFQAFPQSGWSPKPTPGPDAHALLRRQNTLPEGYLLAPDNTCGFISANPKSAYACLGDGMTCAFAPSSGRVPGAAGCCSGSQCAFRLACFDNREMDDCDDDCQADAMTLKCTGAAKFCNTVAFPGGVTDYFCGTKRAVEYKAQTTNSDDTTRSMSTVKSTTSTTSTSKKTSTTPTKSSSSSSSSSKSSSTTKSSTSSTSSETSTSSTESSTAEASTTDASNTDPSATETPVMTSSVSTTSDTAVAGAATVSTTPATSDAPSTPVGGIVGGVVGGVAAIALIILGAFFLRRHKKKNDADAAAAVQPPGSFMSEPTIPPVATYAQPAASPRGPAYNSSAPYQSSASAPSAHMYATPAAAAAAAAPVSAFSSYKNNNRSNSAHSSGAYYPEPSPLTTPSGSPRPQYQHQPHAPSPVVPPAYYQQHDRSSNQSATWTGAEPLDRRSTTTPVSTYHGATPVTPVSALGPMPGEQGTGSGSGGMPGVPLILQPGMGYRPYRPPSSATTGTGPGRPATAGSGTGGRDRNDSISELPAVGVAKAVSISRKPVARSTSGSKPQQVAPRQSEGSAVEATAPGNAQGEGHGTAAELP